MPFGLLWSIPNPLRMFNYIEQLHPHNMSVRKYLAPTKFYKKDFNKLVLALVCLMAYLIGTLLIFAKISKISLC